MEVGRWKLDDRRWDDGTIERGNDGTRGEGTINAKRQTLNAELLIIKIILQIFRSQIKKNKSEQKT